MVDEFIRHCHKSKSSSHINVVMLGFNCSSKNCNPSMKPLVFKIYEKMPNMA